MTTKGDAFVIASLLSKGDGPIDIESWTVLHGKEGPEHGYLVGLTAEGRRAWGTTADPDQMQAMLSEELAGRKAELRPDGAFELL